MNPTYFNETKVREQCKETSMYVLLDCFLKLRNEVALIDYFDFSHNKNVCFSADFGGENDQSDYNTYTFTFHTYSTLNTWKQEIDALRAEMSYGKPAEYKKIKPTVREGKLRDWINTSKEHFRGVIISFAVSKDIESLFAATQAELHRYISAVPGLEGCPLSPKVLEKAIRISNFASLALSQILLESGGYWCFIDNDAVAHDASRWAYTRQLFSSIFAGYNSHLTDILEGFSTPFKLEDEPAYFSEDVLSLSDLISGAIDDYTNHYKGKTPEEMMTSLKPKTIEILSALRDLPTFVYLVEKDDVNTFAKRVDIYVHEPTTEE